MNKYSFDFSNNYNLRPEQQFKFDYNKPSVIFTAGPTGAGKSSLVKKTLELLYKNKELPVFYSFLVDDFIENSDEYKSRVKKSIIDFECNKTTEVGSKCDIITPDKDLNDALENAYFDIRRNGPCNKDHKESCDEYYDKSWHDAVDSKMNIAIEITGKKFPLDYLKYFQDYNVVFVYSLVNFDTLIQRNKSRAINSMQNFLLDDNQPAPRMPVIIPNILKAATKKINDTLLLLRNICLRRGRPPQEICGPINSNGRYVLLIYDNNNIRSKLIYDSRTSDNLMTEQEFITLLSQFQLSGGAYNLKKKKTYRLIKKKMYKSKKNIINKNTKKKNKTSKNRKGGTILGIGKDGCVFDSIYCSDLSENKNYVAKFLYNNKKINIELNNKLAELDPNNERFNRYYFPDMNNCIEKENYNQDFIECSKKGKISKSNMVFEYRLEPFNEQKMTKSQYRYLRDSLQLLHDNNISHGDLPTNVMLNPMNNMPVIIDWEEAKMNADSLDKQIDMNAFLDYYKVGK